MSEVGAGSKFLKELTGRHDGEIFAGGTGREQKVYLDTDEHGFVGLKNHKNQSV
jgi:hypothetical protein